MNSTNVFKPDINSFIEPYFFFSNNSDTELLYVSPSVSRILGYTPEEIVGRKYTELLDIENPLNVDLEVCRKQRFELGRDDHYERLRAVKSKENDLKILKIQTYGVRNEQGQVVTNHGIARDVTAFLSAEEQLHKRLALLSRVDGALRDRERVVLTSIIEGKKNKVIAKELDVSERTIEKIRSRLMVKFGAGTIPEVVSMATEYKTLRDVIFLGRESEQCFDPSCAL